MIFPDNPGPYALAIFSVASQCSKFFIVIQASIDSVNFDFAAISIAMNCF